MVNIQFVQKEPTPKKSQNQSSAFHWQGQRASPYLKDGQPLTWLQVQEIVAELMKERGIAYTSVSDLQRKLPALIFSLQQEVDALKAEKAAAKAKK